MKSHVTRLKATGVYGRFDLEQELQPGVNIIYGKNGTGKTTFLHILANVLNADYKRFAYLKFVSIEAVFDDGEAVLVTREPEGKDARIIVAVDGHLVCSFTRNEVRHELRGRLIRHTQPPLFEEPATEPEALLPADYFPGLSADD